MSSAPAAPRSHPTAFMLHARDFGSESNAHREAYVSDAYFADRARERFAAWRVDCFRATHGSGDPVRFLKVGVCAEEHARLQPPKACRDQAIAR